MRWPRLSSVVERRLLVNYRIDPEIATRLLPAPLRPQRIGDWAAAGICLIRLGQVRPSWVPGALGMRSENAAHRIAVEWDGPDGPLTGVYIPRRDTGSLIAAAVGGWVFPGRHEPAAFDVRETEGDFHVALRSRDGLTRVSVDARLSDRLAGSVLFGGLEEASEFFRRGSAGFSPARDGGSLDRVDLHTDGWHMEPLEIRDVRSSFFDDPERFPQGSAIVDSALLMRDLAATWHPYKQREQGEILSLNKLLVSWNGTIAMRQKESGSRLWTMGSGRQYL